MNVFGCTEAGANLACLPRRTMERNDYNMPLIQRSSHKGAFAGVAKFKENIFSGCIHFGFDKGSASTPVCIQKGSESIAPVRARKQTWSKGLSEMPAEISAFPAQLRKGEKSMRNLLLAAVAVSALMLVGCASRCAPKCAPAAYCPPAPMPMHQLEK